MDDGLDEDAQVLAGLPGLVALQADPEAGRARLVEGHLEHELLAAVLQQQAARLLAFLRGTNGDRLFNSEFRFLLKCCVKKAFSRTHLIPALHNNCCV